MFKHTCSMCLTEFGKAEIENSHGICPKCLDHFNTYLWDVRLMMAKLRELRKRRETPNQYEREIKHLEESIDELFVKNSKLFNMEKAYGKL